MISFFSASQWHRARFQFFFDALIRQRLAFSSCFDACDCRAREVCKIKFVEIFSAEGHVCRTAEMNCPTVPGEQSFFARRADAPDFVRGVTANVKISFRVEGEAIRKTS